MMRSFDQYGNVMLEDTFERHVVGNVYADERVRALLSVLLLSVWLREGPSQRQRQLPCRCGMLPKRIWTYAIFLKTRPPESARSHRQD